MLVDPPRRDGGPHLPHLVQAGGLLGHLHVGEDPNSPSNRLPSQPPHVEGELPWDHLAVRLDVEGLDGYGAVVGLVGHQGLGPLHAGARRVDGPRDPAPRLWRGGDEGDGEGGVGTVVGPVEEGVEVREVDAVGVDLVAVGGVGELLGGAGEGGGSGGEECEEEKEEEEENGTRWWLWRRHCCRVGVKGKSTREER